MWPHSLLRGPGNKWVVNNLHSFNSKDKYQYIFWKEDKRNSIIIIEAGLWNIEYIEFALWDYWAKCENIFLVPCQHDIIDISWTQTTQYKIQITDLGNTSPTKYCDRNWLESYDDLKNMRDQALINLTRLSKAFFLFNLRRWGACNYLSLSAWIIHWLFVFQRKYRGGDDWAFSSSVGDSVAGEL